MDYGDVGDNFYFILFGEVDVHIPDPNKLQRFKNLQKEINMEQEALDNVKMQIKKFDNKQKETTIVSKKSSSHNFQ